MCGTHLGSTTRRARKDHSCCACRIPIPAGHTYIVTSDVDEGRASSAKWHVECSEEFARGLREWGEDCGDPWTTWENGMPAEIAQRYVHGPIEIDANRETT